MSLFPYSRIKTNINCTAHSVVEMPQRTRSTFPFSANNVFFQFFPHWSSRKFHQLERQRRTSWVFLYVSLNRAIGVGAVQANMAVFGAEQVREHKATTQYFDKYYAVVNTGGLIAFAFIAYAQQNDSYFLGYIVPAALLLVAFILFLIGYQFYTHVPPQDSVIGHIIPVLINAFQTWRKHRLAARRSAPSPRASNLFGNQIDNSDQLSSSTSGQSWSFLDYAKLSNQGRFIDRVVDDIKSLRRIVVVFLLLTPYWLLYFQVSSFRLSS